MRKDKDLLQGTVEGFLRDMQLPVVTHFGVWVLLKKHFPVLVDSDNLLVVTAEADGVEFELAERKVASGTMWSLSENRDGHSRLMWTQKSVGRKLQTPEIYS